jgi:putative colanic acid biosysnthesis UDP-glucose lipid carrier transferase
MPTPKYSKYQKTISLIGDLLIINIAFIIGYYFRFGTAYHKVYYQVLPLLLIYNFSWWIIISQSDFIVGMRGVQLYNILLRHSRNTLMHGAVIFLAIVVFHFYALSRLMLVYAFVIQFVLILIWRFVYFWLLNEYRKAGYNFRNVVILGTNENSVTLYKEFISKNNYGYRFLAFFDTPDQMKPVGHAAVHDLAKLEEFAILENVDEVYCTLFDEKADEIQKAIQLCEKNLIRFKMVPSYFRFIKRKVTIELIDNIPVLLLRDEPLQSTFARFTKRTFDIVFSSLVILLILSWLVPIIALMIKIESRGPVFFKQPRTGRGNKNFYIIKFRSMLMNQEADSLQAQKGDPRITKFGNFLRKTSLDELPQFFNVFIGDMSVVGPRPHMLQHTLKYSEQINKYMVRHFVKPGITGWAQVNGYRGETINSVKMLKRIKYDVWYVENWTLVLDIFIVFKTLVNMFIGDKNAG